MPTHQVGPDIRTDRLLRQWIADGVDDRRGRLMFGEGTHGAGHGVGRYECRTDERQEYERGGESVRTVR